MSKNTRNRILLTALAALLLVVVAVGGTMAYLKASTVTVTNTFTSSKVGVTLTETTGSTYQVIPGVNITKDPKVTVDADVEAYVFVKVEKTGTWPTGVTYDIADGWTQHTANNDIYIYYRVYNPDATPAQAKEFAVIKNNTITVPSTLTNADLQSPKFDNPQLKFTAYAIQKAGFDTPEAAWTAVAN